MGIKVTDTVLRDGHQSLLATRMRTEDMLPIAEKLDQVGYHSLEVWGGATFDVPLRFLREDPWERLRVLKKHFKKTPLQMLLRGQNVVGYRHYADDVVERFVYKAKENGIDIFRIFDAVNDLRNLQTAIQATKRAGGHVQATISYTISPVHNAETYVAQARQLEEMGADSICLKDMAGLLHPYEAYNLIKRMKEAVRVPIQLHTHYTSGMATMCILKAAEAGVDVVDTAISSMAQSTSQAPTESVVAALQDTPYDTGLNLELLAEIAAYFVGVRKKYAAFENPSLGVDVGVLIHQIPGGMVSNLVNQLRDANSLNRLNEVLAEVPRVREDLGYPPLVTPTSQIVGTQAVLNVLYGERYKVMPKEVQLYIQGYYGRSPAPIKPELIDRVAKEGLQIIEGRPADYLEPEVEKAAKEIGDLAKSEEDILAYALFPPVAREFLEWRAAGDGLDKEIVAAIAAAIAQRQPQGTPAAATSGAATDGSAWKMFGRRRAMRIR